MFTINSVSDASSSSSIGVESCLTYRPFSNEQIDSGMSILNYFNGGDVNRWAILMAQMQSGKTDTFLFIAAEMVRLGRVSNVVIFSGNADTMLKTQIVNIVSNNVVEEKSFYVKYRMYLKECEGVPDVECSRIITHLLSAGVVSVRWGTELAKYQGPTKNTLFIWEESHYAQNKNQMPSKMLKRVGISANGDAGQLSSKRNYVVSVSATGFSEFSDNHHLEQGKWLELLQPGDGYNSVEDMMRSGRIVPYDNVADGIRSAMLLATNTPKYGLIRATKQMECQIVPILKAYGWRVVFHDSLTESTDGSIVWNNMHRTPTRNTAIILKGKCRMGQNVEKAHLLFCFETAQNSKTDTVLQSFVGRASGYSVGSNKVLVYIPSKIYHSGELEKYVELSNGSMCIPSNARNIVQNNQKNHADGLYPIIPIHISRDEISTVGGDRADYRADIISAFNTDSYTNYNSAEVLDNIKALVETPDTMFKLTNTNTTTAIRSKLKEKIEESTISRVAINPGSSFGVDINGTEINVWKMPNGDVYIYCIVADSEKQVKTAETAFIPKTTLKEVFCHKFEDGTEENTNGGFSLNLTPETAFSADRMEAELSELIELSLTTMLVSISRSVNSIKDCEYRGISLNAQVLAGLQPNGEIYARLKTRFDVNIKITKMSGRQSKAHQDAGLVRIAKISW
jgi:hypothetical protein